MYVQKLNWFALFPALAAPTSAGCSCGCLGWLGWLGWDHSPLTDRAQSSRAAVQCLARSRHGMFYKSASARVSLIVHTHMLTLKLFNLNLGHLKILKKMEVTE